MDHVLLLNASYEPLNICSWKRAVILLLKGKAIEVEHNGKDIAPDFPLPTVIRLQHYIKIPHKSVALTRKNILHRDQHQCQYCGKFGHDLTMDHVMPRSRGGKDEWENLVAACMRCNIKKGNKTPEEANMPLRSKPYRPHHFSHFELSKRWKENEDYQAWQKYLFFGT